MAQETATTALVYDARGAVTGAKEFEAASEKVKAANKNAAAASDTLTAASDRLQKAQDAVSKAAERVQKAQETAARAAERFGSQSEQAAQAAERVARATETASRAQDRLSRAQEAAVTATERVAIGLGNQERRLASIEAKYAPAIAAENRLAQTKAYLNGVIERGGPQMERAQRLLEALTEQERKAAQASQQAAQAMAAGTAATVRAAQAQDMAAASTKRLNGFVQQAGYQVSDAANQIATGTNAFTVFGMQAGQLLGTLGPVGAAIGAVVNVAGVAAGVIQKQAEAAAEAAKATDLLTAATRAGLEITESGVDKARRLRDERNEQAGASYRAAIAERELADAIAISATLSARAAMEQTKASNERYLAQGPGRFLGPAELSRIEYEQKVYEGTTKTATETAKRLDEAQQAYEKFRSSLNKTGGFSGEEIDKLRERVDGIVSSYDDATLRTVTLRQKQEELDEAVKAGVITQAQADDILQKYTKHLDENSAAAKEAEKAAKAREKAEEKLEKQILAAVKAADAKAVEEYNKVMGEGRRIYEATRTPAEKYADELVNLRRLLDYGAINQDTFNRAVQAADPAFQEAQKAAERYAQEVNRVAEDIAKDWSETLYDAIILRDKQTSIVDAFRDLFKRIAIEAIKANIVLPITQQIVGAVPSLFGIQAPGSSSAANQNGGGMGGLGSVGNMLSLGSKFMPSSWTSGITGAIDKFGYSALGIGTASSTIIPSVGGAAATTAATTINPATGSLAAYNSWGAAGAQGAGSGVTAGTGLSTGLSGLLGAAGVGAGAGMLGGYLGTATNSKVVGGLSGAAGGALGAMALAGGPVGVAIAAITGLITGMIGTQKATVGKTASADVTINAGGKSSTYGNVQTDNEGDPQVGQALGTALSGIFTMAAMGGGSLTKSFGIGQTQKDGLYVGGSVPYKKFGDDIAGLLRYTLLEQGGLQGGGANTIAALKATKAKDWEEATKDIALGARIDAGNTALREMVKTLDGVTDAAKKATAESFQPMLDEFERAKKLDLGGAYVSLATDQLKAYLDQLRNPVDYTQREQEMAALTGQFAAIREAVAQLNPTMASYVDQIEAETRARIKTQTAQEAAAMLNEAMGRGYLNQIEALKDARDINARNLSAVGLDVSTAGDIFNASLTSLLRGLDDASLSVVAQTFTGDIAKLATAIRNTSDAAVSFATDIAGRVQTALGNDRSAGLIALDQQQATELAQARAAGYDTTQLRMVQAAERGQKAFALAQADVLAAYDAQITAQQALVESLQTSAQAMQQFRQAYDALAVNDNSPLNARDRLAEARRQFEVAYTTAKDASASEAEKTAAIATLQQLGPSLVQLAKGFYGSTDTTDYDRVRQVFAEFAGLQSDGVDTAQSQLDTANATLKELQRQRAEAANLGQKQYGALTDLNSIMNQSYLVWQASLTALQGLTGASSTTSPTTNVDRTIEQKRQRLEAFSNADIEAAFGGFSDIVAARSADQTFNLAHWFRTFGINEVLSGTRSIPGFASGTDSAPPGYAWVGEHGRELVRMAGGERVYPHSVSMDIARSWGAANDRWSGVAEFRRPAASGGGNAEMLAELRRQNRLLEEQNQLLRQGNSTAGMVGDRVVSRLDGVKDEVRGSAARAEFSKKKVA